MSKSSIALIGALSAVLAAFVSVVTSVGAGYYSAIRQCNQDATNMETQLTSILLEINGREARMKAALAADEDKMPSNALKRELASIESGAEGYYGDPLFKDYSLVSLSNQYNRLLRRVRFPEDCSTNPKCGGADKGLMIDTQKTHPEIVTLQITGAKANACARDIDDDFCFKSGGSRLGTRTMDRRASVRLGQ